MIWEDVIPCAFMIVVIIAAALLDRRKSRRYGGYTDPVKIRVSFLRTDGFRRKRPEDGLYDDDGKINRHWKP